VQESCNEKQKRLLRELEGRNIAYYSILANSWVQNRMELDKTLLTLSSAGIGLIVAILTTIDRMGLLLAILFGLAALVFLICIVAILCIFYLNPKLIENELSLMKEELPSVKEKEQEEKDLASLRLKVKRLDRVSWFSFVAGVVLICGVVGVVAAEKIMYTEAFNLTKEKETTSIPEKLRVEKSLEGLQNLRPQEVPQQVQTQTPQQDNTSTGSEQESGSGDKKKD